jgi:peroxiredoxin
LADFQAYQEQLLRENVEVVALSVDAVDKARQTVEQLGLTFPVAYALDVPRDAEKIGAFWEERRRIFHATSFVLDRDRNVLHACYSTGPIGRISAEEALSSLQFARGRIRPGDTQGLSEYLERIRSSVRQDSMEQKHNG